MIGRVNGWTEGMVHPAAAADPLLRPRHMAFLAGSVLTGAAALVVLPLHLALAGPTSLPVTLAIAWMLCQWPLALYLSHTGSLDRAIGLSAGLFGTFIAGICALTGGLSSFALAWLVLVPAESALSGSRRVIAFVGVLCTVLLMALAVVPAAALPQSAAGTGIPLASSLAACAYAAALALRYALDQRAARRLAEDAEARLKKLSAATADITCEIREDGSLAYIGGPLEAIVGLRGRQVGEDWLFQRLHVVDRPTYLTRLADARSARQIAAFDVRLRTGSANPGEAGDARYMWAELRLRPFGNEDDPASCGMLMTIRDITDRKADQEALEDLRRQAGTASTSSGQFWQSAGVELKAPLAEIVSMSDILTRIREAGEGDRRQDADYAGQIHKTGVQMLQTLTDILETAPIEAANDEPHLASVDPAECLDGCRKIMTPVAVRAAIPLEFEQTAELPKVAIDRRLCRQALCHLLSHAIRNGSDGNRVRVSTTGCPDGVAIAVSVTGTGSEAIWQSADARSLLQLVEGVLDRQGSSLRLSSSRRRGPYVEIRLTAVTARAERLPADAETVSEPLPALAG